VSDYQPKVGDRVRATRTIDGVVKNIVPADPTWGGYLDLQPEDGLSWIELHKDDEWTFEKLADPEPEWVNGDVVRYTAPENWVNRGTVHVLARVSGFWVDTERGRSVLYSPDDFPYLWEQGLVEILYKAGVGW